MQENSVGIEPDIGHGAEAALAGGTISQEHAKLMKLGEFWCSVARNDTRCMKIVVAPAHIKVAEMVVDNDLA